MPGFAHPSAAEAGPHVTATPLWSSQVGTGAGKHPEVEPVYSPDGTQVAFVHNQSGQNTWTGFIVGAGGELNSAENVSMSTQGNGIINDQPDWGPGGPGTGTPEVPIELDAAWLRFHHRRAGLGGGVQAAYRDLRFNAHAEKFTHRQSGRHVRVTGPRDLRTIIRDA